MKKAKQADYILKRSDRKTISLQVLPDGEILVRAPRRLPQDFIDGFLDQKRDWIESRRKLMAERREAIRSFDYRAVRLFGRVYPVWRTNERTVRFDGKHVLVPREAELKQALIKWYKASAKEVFAERTAVFQDKMGVEPKEIKISSAKTRWGSCSSEGRLSFSWKLLMAEGKTIDYVVVHELAHLKHMDHSDDFWTLVGQYFLEYELERARLKELKEVVIKEGWEER